MSGLERVGSSRRRPTLAREGVSKVGAIRRWCETRGFSAEEVLAIGDGTNDLDMLAWAGVSVAIRGSACERADADHVVAPPQEGGWARIVELL